MRTLARYWRAPALAALLVVAVVFPLVDTSAVDTTFAINTLIYVAAVTGWSMFSGNTGYVSLGHAVFFGTGAYAVGLLAWHQHLTGDVIFATLPLGGLAAAAVAVPFGLVALRVRRHTFVVVTIAIFFIFQLLAFNLAFTQGNQGVSAPFLQWNPATYNNPFYYAGLIIAVLTIAWSWQIRRSKFGLQLRAIRDDEDRARGLGVRAMRSKLAAFVISAFVTGVVGGLWFYFIGQALPETVFDPTFDLTVALMAFLGGFGTRWWAPPWSPPPGRPTGSSPGLSLGARATLRIASTQSVRHRLTVLRPERAGPHGSRQRDRILAARRVRRAERVS